MNGIERVIVSQLVRSAGAFFTAEMLRSRRYYGAKVIPNRGAWLEFETDGNNVIWVKIDRKAQGGRNVAYARIRLFHGRRHDPRAFYRRRHSSDEPLHRGDDWKRRRRRTRTKVSSKCTSAFVRGSRHRGQREVAYPLDVLQVRAVRLGRRRAAISSISAFGLCPRNRTMWGKEENRILTKEDLARIFERNHPAEQHAGRTGRRGPLGNRRIRAIGELVQSRFRIGLARMERIVKDRMSTQDITAITPPSSSTRGRVIGAVREFFMSSSCRSSWIRRIRCRNSSTSVGFPRWVRRAFTRDARVRRARRASHALRPHLSDRVAGRSEHRPCRATLRATRASTISGLSKRRIEKSSHGSKNDGKAGIVNETLRVDVTDGKGAVVGKKGAKMSGRRSAKGASKAAST